MRVGLFGARADDRGLGRLTVDFYDHLHPDRTLVIDMGALARGFTQHFDRYPTDATVVRFDGLLDEDVMAAFFAGLDVAVFYETAYDHRAYAIARDAGCRTVLYAMPEFHRHLSERLPHPDVVWVPTTWRLDDLPPGTRVVPAPVALERFDPPATRPDGPLRVLHVAGHRAAWDRNGTTTFLRALRGVQSRVDVRVVCQDQRLPAWRPSGTHITFSRHLGGVADYWRLYDNADVLVLPRRYGGLCLPANEALAAGLALVMPDIEPNRATWPIIPVGARRHAEVTTPGGPMALWESSAAELTATIDRLARQPAVLTAAQGAARRWAADHSWDALAGRYRDELALAAG